MFRHLLIASLLCVCLVAAVHAQQPSVSTKPADAPDYSREAYVVEKFATVYRFENDGRGIKRETARFRVQSEAALQALGQLVFAYNSENESLKINYVRVLKSDGTVITADASAVQDMTTPIALQAPVYSDLRQKHVTVPSLRPGEVLEYETEVQLREPLAPGEFWVDHSFANDVISLDESLEVDIPAGRKIQLKTEPGFEAKKTEAGGRAVYRWTTQRLEREENSKKKKKEAAKTRKDEHADVALTTFADWDGLAAWYAGLEKDRRQPTTEIKAKTEELIRGAKSDREKAEAIYDYVGKNFRYVSLSFGVGRYQPHVAGEIFKNQYGDCKDKHTLLASMLMAAGLTTDTVLIHSQRKLDRDIPSPSQFNHVISAVHIGNERIILDTTPEIASFAMLWAALRSKDAVLVRADGKAEVIKTPLDPPFESKQLIEIDGKITELGRLERHIKYTLRGDLELAMRTLFRRVPEPKWKEVMENIAAYDGMSGEVKELKVGDIADLRKPFVVDMVLVTPNYLNISSKNSKVDVPLPRLQIPIPDEDDPEPADLGAKGNVLLSAKLEVPEKFKATLPVPVTIKRDYAEFRSTYKLEKNIFTASRSIDVLMPKVPKSRSGDIMAFRNVVHKDGEQTIGMEVDDVTAASAPKDADAEELHDAGVAAFESQNYKQAIVLLEKVVELEPKHKYGWNNLGRAYMYSAELEKAEKAFKKQIEINPYDEYAYNNLGQDYEQMKREEEAIEAYRKQIEVNPLDAYAHRNLGRLLVTRHRYAEAIPELEQCLAMTPEDMFLKQQLGSAYLKTGQVDKALEHFEQALKKAPIPMMWNNVAYALSEHKESLDRARGYAESAVSMTTTGLNSLPTAQASFAGVALTQSLASYWDTLGWICFKQDKLDDAEKFIGASWDLAQKGEVGDHLAQIYEKRGLKDRAAEMYAKAMAASAPVPETRERLAALVGAKNVDGKVDQMRAKLGAERTYSLGKAALDGSAEFNIVMRGTTVESVEYASGKPELKSYEAKLKEVKYSQRVPDQQIRLVRRGIVNCSKTTSRCDLVLIPVTAVTMTAPGNAITDPVQLQELLKELNKSQSGAEE